MYELRKKVRLINGKKTPESRKALEVRVAALEAKTDKSSNESLFSDVEKPKAIIIKLFQPLTEWEAKLDRPMQTLDGWGYQ